MADIDDDVLTRFLIEDEVMFDVNGDHFKGYKGRWFQGQVVRRKLEPWAEGKKPEFFACVRHIEKDKPGPDGKILDGTDWEEDF
mmetsp:Transcript_50052/g.124857  ORF Transcript_50052/g.124857 Transcript_50052/m.124857 type:complete len:84 (+) Transcript_50052:62-313(+)